VTWTKGIDPKTGKPIDYDPARDVQIYAEPANVNDDKVTRRVCPTMPAAPTTGRHPSAARPAWSTFPSSKAVPT
jgi:alcohol dehydrogenase (cytochrome c)